MKPEFPSSANDRVLAWRPLAVLLLLFGVYAWASTSVLLARSVLTLGLGSQLGIALAAMVSMYMLARLFSGPMGLWLRLPNLPERHALGIALALGVSLRLCWVLAFHPAPASDGLTYLFLAKQVVAGNGLALPGALAFWPPGYAIFLAPFLLASSAIVAVPLSQILLFVVAAIGVYRLTRQLASPTAAALSVFLFALWPNLVAICATPEKEMLSTTLLVWSVIAILSNRAPHIFLGGILLGYAALVQPSTQLLIPAAMLLLLVRWGRSRWFLVPLVLLGAAIVVGPWSARNFAALGEFKLISTNGGDVLYRANNGLATGGYTEAGEVDLSALPELVRDKAGKTLAIAWIREHPARFSALAIEKQILFMGDDAYGIYSTFRAQGGGRDVRMYAVLKLVSNLWWLCAWLAIAILTWQRVALGNVAFLIWGWLYFFGLHSVFESGGKYHVPSLWIMCIILGVLASNKAAQRAIGNDGAFAASMRQRHATRVHVASQS